MVLSGPPPEPLTTLVSRTTGISEVGRSELGAAAGCSRGGRGIGGRSGVEDPAFEAAGLLGPALIRQAGEGSPLVFRQVGREARPDGRRERLGGICQVEAVGPGTGGGQVADHDGPT